MFDLDPNFAWKGIEHISLNFVRCMYILKGQPSEKGFLQYV